MKFAKKMPWWNGETILIKGIYNLTSIIAKVCRKMQFWVKDESRIFLRLHFYSTQKPAGAL